MVSIWSELCHFFANESCTSTACSECLLRNYPQSNKKLGSGLGYNALLLRWNFL